MLSKLAYGVTAILFIVRNLPTIIGLYQLIKSWPGTNDVTKLQAWVIAALKDGKTLALATSNTIDDKVIDAAILIASNDAAWDAVYLMRLSGGTLAGEAFENGCHLIAEKVGDGKAENPILILNAVLLILQIIKTFKK